MSYIIAIMNDETDTKYVEWLNGIAPPKLTENIMLAKRFEAETEAEKYAAKLSEKARKEGSETTSIEVIEFVNAPEENPPLGNPPDVPQAEQNEPNIPGWKIGGRFIFGKNIAYFFLMRKGSDGKLLYTIADKIGQVLLPPTENHVGALQQLAEICCQSAEAAIDAFNAKK